jgi:hypothetical protein
LREAQSRKGTNAFTVTGSGPLLNCRRDLLRRYRCGNQRSHQTATRSPLSPARSSSCSRHCAHCANLKIFAHRFLAEKSAGFENPAGNDRFSKTRVFEKRMSGRDSTEWAYATRSHRLGWRRLGNCMTASAHSGTMSSSASSVPSEGIIIMPTASFTLSDVKDIFTILSVLIAVLTFIAAVIEYRRKNKENERQNALERFNKYQSMQNWFRADPGMWNVIEDAFSRETPTEMCSSWKDRMKFLVFYEQIQLMINSNLMVPDVAYYTFGPHAVEFFEKDGMWQGTSRDDPDWKLFSVFVENAKDFARRYRQNSHLPVGLRY